MNIILYAVLAFISLLYGLAAVIFAWAVDAKVWLELFNMSATYTMWGMVRDFFNLFFILTLLFVAFGTIFQIQAYNYRKWLLQLVLMALLVNFSFPVSRFIVDATNVPMYFFIDSILGPSNQSATNIFEQLMGNSGYSKFLLPSTAKSSLWEGKTTGFLIQAIVFTFLLAASLLMLAALFLVRLVALLLLVIFSPIGFAASAIPGLERFSKQWWDYFMKYAFFGPAAMLMILVAVTFLKNFKNGSAATTITTITSGIRTSADNTSLITSMVITIIPVIMIWAAMSVGNMMGIYGADAVKKYAMGAMKFVTGITAGKKRVDAYRSERKKLKDDRFSRNNVGTRFGQHRNLVSERNAAQSRFRTEAGRKMAATGALTREQELVKEEAKRRAINSNTSISELEKQHAEAKSRKDGLHMTAVLDEMRKRPELQGKMENADMKLVEDHFKDRGGMDNAVVKETRANVAEVNLKAAYGTDVKEMTKVLKSGRVKFESQTANALTSEVLAAGLTANKINQTVLDELSKDGEKSVKISENLDTAVAQFDPDIKAKIDAAGSPQEKKILEKQRTAAHQAYFSREGEFHNSVKTNIAVQDSVYKKADALTLDAVSKNPDNLAAIMPMLLANGGASKTVSNLAKLAEDGAKINKSTDKIIELAAAEVDKTNLAAVALKKEAESAHKSMGRDHRFGLVDRVPENN